MVVNIYISHLLFVDDILLFNNGRRSETKELKRILELFLKATGMLVNKEKSHLLLEGFNRMEAFNIAEDLPFEERKLEDSFKYLGFFLNPHSYKKQDWFWLVAKIESRIKHWSFKWLSRPGRLALIKPVLLAIPVYWAALTWVPKGILERIRRVCNRFLWAGSKEESVLPWVAWDKVVRPKEWGEWGIKELTAFGQSLEAKLGWRLIKMENL